MKGIAIILSGGTGSRMNMEIPKQYVRVGDRMIITESIIPFMECELVDGIQIVAEKTWRDRICADLRTQESISSCGFSSPGANRQLSILNALRDIRQDMEDDDIVIIHDAARPLVTTEMITAYINAICEKSPAERSDTAEILHDGVMPVISMKDTVYYSENGCSVDKLLERDKLYAGQAPEVFRYGKYLDACERLLPDKIMDIRGSTEPAILAGMDIVMVPGDGKNFKITTRDDLDRYREIVESKKQGI